LALTLTISYSGAATNLPSDLLTYYVGVNHREVHVKQIGIRIEADIKRWSLLHPFGWEYYQWVDSFIKKLEADIDRDTFLERINWDTISAHFFVSNKIRRMNERKAEVKKNHLETTNVTDETTVPELPRE
jgi:hypothetical protein